MTDYNFGGIVLVPFPFTDQSITKKGPAVVVSSEEYNFQRPDIGNQDRSTLQKALKTILRE